jgi:hypothetical protein
MTILRPPRREPRVLALRPAPEGIAFAVCDPWELRSCGIARCRSPARKLAIRRIIRREKPTLLTALDPELLRLIESISSRFGIPAVRGALQPPSVDQAQQLLDGMVTQAPTPTLQDTVCLALAVALSAPVTHRKYACRNRPTLRTAR